MQSLDNIICDLIFKCKCSVLYEVVTCFSRRRVGEGECFQTIFSLIMSEVRCAPVWTLTHVLIILIPQSSTSCTTAAPWLLEYWDLVLVSLLSSQPICCVYSNIQHNWNIKYFAIVCKNILAKLLSCNVFCSEQQHGLSRASDPEPEDWDH